MTATVLLYLLGIQCLATFLLLLTMIFNEPKL